MSYVLSDKFKTAFHQSIYFVRCKKKHGIIKYIYIPEVYFKILHFLMYFNNKSVHSFDKLRVVISL